MKTGQDAKHQIKQSPPDKSSAAPRSKSSGPRGGCFHCDKEHFLSDCPDIVEAQKEAILAERAPRKRASKKQRLKRVNLCARGAERVRATATINGALDLPYCASSGSEYNIISQELAEKLRAVDNGVELVELIEHVELEAVGGAIRTATHAVDVQLTLNTAAGPWEQLTARSGSDDDHFGNPNGIPSRGVTEDAEVATVIEAMATDAVMREMVDGAGAAMIHLLRATT
ncbi:hypothetical protein PHMEG_00032670 [Phytophthora megakarya]|uniref:Uncharacterized protein n=1 Tax=Phytophthora megakarya TaxID=4795 RepID=A0A225UV57_9STRA|nr:hypothetical protein PHMEG_00032670 [Phytophthora megakarya]